MSNAPPFLVLEDEPGLARDLRRRFGAHGPVRLAHTVAEALEFLESEADFAGFVLDVGLPDGSGLDVLRAARERFPDVDALVVTAFVEPEPINQAVSLGAFFVAKPYTSRELEPFIERCLERGKSEAPRSLYQEVLGAQNVSPESREEALGRLREASGLTPRESTLIGFHLDGLTRSEVAEALSINIKTYDSHAGRILSKTGAPTMYMLCVRLLLAAQSERK
ncbi:MAG: response regulator transcription factor [Myxococcota bacterium]